MARPFTLLTDSFKVLRDNLNTVSYNVGDPTNLLTNGDSDVVMAINEIERVFDASAGEILYPTGNALQGETETRLLISTAQNSGTDITLKSGLDVNVDAVGDINLDAGGANINFLDDSVNRFAFTLGATNQLAVTGVLDLNISSNLDADISGNSTLTTTGTQTQEGTTLNLDFSGDITLDADGNDIVFKNGAGTDTVNHNLADNGVYTITAPSNYVVDVVGDIVLDAGGDNITLKDAGTTRQTYSLGATTTVATTGNRTETVSGNVSDSANGTYHIGASGNTDITTMGTFTTVSDSQTHGVTGNYDLNVSGNVSDSAGGTYHIGSKGNMDLTSMGTLDLVSDDLTATVNGNVLVNASGDITLDADGNDVILKDGANQRIKHTLGATNTTAVTGHYNTTASNRSDSASGTYHIGSTGNMDLDTRGTFDVVSGGNLTATVTGDAVVDASGDITLDVDGDDIYFKQAGATKITYNLGTNQEIDVAGNLTYDVAGDIVLDADGGDIDFKDAGTTKFAFGMGSTNTLDVTQSFKHTTGSNWTDSAGGARYLNSTGHLIATSLNGISTTASGAQTHRADGGLYTIVASNDVNITAQGDQFRLKNSSGDRIVYNFGANQEIDVTGNLTYDVEGDIILDAGGDNIYLKDSGTTRQTYTLGATNTIATTGNLTQTTTGNRTYTVAGDQDDSANGTRNISATAGINIDTLGPMTLTAGGSQNLVSGGNWKATVTGSATIDASTDIILDPAGNDIILKNAGTQWGKLRDSGTNVTLYSGTTKAVSWTGANQRAEGNLHVLGTTNIASTLNVDGNVTLNKNVDLGNGTGDNISIIGRVDTNIIPDANNTYDLGSDTLQWKHAFFDGTVTTDDLVADSADIGNFNIVGDSISNSNAVGLTTGALTATVTGDVLIDASGDIKLDVDGDDIYFAQAGTTKITYNLGSDQEIDVAGALTYDVGGDIILDADGGDVYLKDAGTQFGRFNNSGGHLDIYSGTGRAIEIDAGKVEIQGRPLFTDSDLSTVAQDVAGGINELHTQLDSAVSQINVNEGRITTNASNHSALDARVGALSSLDSDTAGNFFTTASINNDSIVNAINELARRTVLIYDVNGTLLN